MAVVPRAATAAPGDPIHATPAIQYNCNGTGPTILVTFLLTNSEQEPMTIQRASVNGQAITLSPNPVPFYTSAQSAAVSLPADKYTEVKYSLQVSLNRLGTTTLDRTFNVGCADRTTTTLAPATTTTHRPTTTVAPTTVRSTLPPTTRLQASTTTTTAIDEPIPDEPAADNDSGKRRTVSESETALAPVATSGSSSAAAWIAIGFAVVALIVGGAVIGWLLRTRPDDQGVK